MSEKKDKKTAEDVGREFEAAGWRKTTSGTAVFYTKEVSPSVLEKIRESAGKTKKAESEGRGVPWSRALVVYVRK